MGVSLNVLGVKEHVEPLSDEIVVRLFFGVHDFSIGIFGWLMHSLT